MTAIDQPPGHRVETRLLNLRLACGGSPAATFAARGPGRLRKPVISLARRGLEELDGLEDVLRGFPNRLAVRVTGPTQLIGGDVGGLAMVLVWLAAAAVHAHWADSLFRLRG